MRSVRILFAGLLVLIFCSSPARSQDFEVAVNEVVPNGVELGMSISSLKEKRPSIFDGPSAANFRGEPHQTFMETQGLGKPGFVSYWYLTSNDQVVGVIKTTSHAGIDEAVFANQAQGIFSALVSTLGKPCHEKILRKDEESFIPVRADVWKDSASGLMIYFVATTREITMAAIKPSDFPLNQVFIRPDPQRFPSGQLEEASIRGIERDASETQSVQAVSTSRSDKQSESVLAGSSQEESPHSNLGVANDPRDEQTGTRRNPNYVAWVLGAVLLLGLAIILFVPESRRL